MQIKLNGNITEIPSTDLAGLVRDRGLDPSCLVVEHNRVVVRQEDWATVPLNEGDEVELLNFVGGG